MASLKLTFQDSSGNIGIGTYTPSYKFQITEPDYARVSLHQSTTGAIWQWGNDGSNMYAYYTNTGVRAIDIKQNGNVGIGTTSPNDKLEVSGNLRFTSKANSIFFGSSGGDGTWSAPKITRIGTFIAISDYSGVQLGGYNGSAYGPVMTINGSGKVGVGTTTPDAALHAKGIGDGTYIFRGLSSAGTDLGGLYQSTAGDGEIYLKTSAVSTKVRISSNNVTYFNGGNVGIQTTVPTARLHIEAGDGGDTRSIKSVLPSASTYNPAAYNTEDRVVSGFKFGWYSDYWQIGAARGGGTDVDGLIFSRSGTETLVLKEDGSVGVGTTNPLFKFAAVSEETTGVNRVVGIFAKSGTSHGSTILRVGRTQLTSTTPSDDVQVVDIEHNSGGAGPFRYGTYADGVISNGSSATTGPYGALHFATSGSVRMTVGGGTLAGNVGIGTMNPGATLDVNGRIISRNDVYISSTYPRIWLNDTNDNSDYSIINNNGHLGFYDDTNAAFRFYINKNGNVGVNTASPAYKLDVSGTLRATSTIYANADINSNGGNILRFTVGVNAASGFTVYNAAENGYLSNRITTDAHSRGWGWELTNSTANSATVTAYHRFGYGASAPSWLANGTGNVGIGTTTPGYKLDVNGNAAISGGNRLWFKAGSDIGLENAASDNAIYIANTGAAGSSVLDIGTGTMVIEEGVNVGIGTTSPSAKLHIHHTSEEVLRIDSGTTGAIHFFEGTTRRGIIGYSNGTSIAVAADAGDMVVRSESTNKLHFSNGSVVAMTVDTSQNVGIGTTSPSYPLEVTGTAAATSFLETSARKFKENIEPIEGALDAVNNLQGVTFNRIGEEKREYGFIADEVQTIVPELVSYDANGEVHGVHYARTVAILTEAVKELDNKVKAQDLFIKDLVARIEKLENK